MKQENVLKNQESNQSHAEQFEEGFLDDDKRNLNTLKGKAELTNLSKSVGLLSVESIIDDGKLDDTLFADDHELAVFQKWAEKFLFMQVSKQKDFDREGNKDNTIKSTYKLGGITDYQMVLPEDLSQIKVSDIPYIVKNVNTLSFGNTVATMPNWASSKEIAVYMQTLIQYLTEIGNTALATSYRQLYTKYYGDIPVIACDNTLKQEFQKKYADIQDVPPQIESDLASFFKKHLFQSVLEGGTKMLYENMKAPDSEQYRGLMQYMKPFGDALKKAKQSHAASDSLADKDMLFKAEQQFIEELYGQVTKYTDALETREKYTFPTDVVQSKEMLCVSKTMLIHGILDYYGFQNGVNEIDRHIYNTVTLSNGDYVIDGIDDIAYDWKENKYTNDYNKKLLYKDNKKLSVDDVLMGETLHSLAYITSPTEQDIMSLELATKINPDNVWATISLAYTYEALGTEKDTALAYEYYDKANIILQKIIKEKKSEYGFDYDFKKIQIAIHKGLYQLNKENSYNRSLLEGQKQTLMTVLTEQIKIQKEEVANGTRTGTMSQVSQDFKNNEIFWWGISLDQLQGE